MVEKIKFTHLPFERGDYLADMGREKSIKMYLAAGFIEIRLSIISNNFFYSEKCAYFISVFPVF
jgi:hypothetical protein